MKLLSMVLMLVFTLGWAGVAFCETNPLASGVEHVTKAPLMMLMGGSEHPFTPVKEINKGALTITDQARAAAISAGLNLGQAVD